MGDNWLLYAILIVGAIILFAAGNKPVTSCSGNGFNYDACLHENGEFLGR